MLDVLDFIADKGGNPQKIKESQRRRFAPEEVVDEVIALYEDHRKSEESCPTNNIPYSLHQSAVRSYANKYKNQRRPKTDRSQEEGRLAGYPVIHTQMQTLTSL